MVLEVTVTDRTGWEYGREQRTYSNTGMDREGNATAVAWDIVERAPASTALAPDETRRESISFAVEPWEAETFIVHARLHYRFAPVATGFGGTGAGELMTEASSEVSGHGKSRRSKVLPDPTGSGDG